MSEPARSFPPHETDDRPAPAPLRDWLAAMKAQVPAAHVPAAQMPAAPRDEAPSEKAARGAETGWSPRLVQPTEAPRAAEDPDVAELMAENLLLKAKLRLEGERQGQLQAMLADEIRALRQHIRDEMGSLEDLRAEQEEVRAEREEVRSEREGLRAERDQASAERDALRTEHQALTTERDALREERDLWRARTETLAQPLFQLQKR